MEDKLNVLAPEVAKVDEIDKNNLTVVLELLREVLVIQSCIV